MTADEDWEPKPVYTGICIDGPLAGSWLSHRDPQYKTVEHMPASIYGIEQYFSAVDTTVKSHTYKWIVGFRHRVDGKWSEDVLNFWIPQGKDYSPLDCVKMMAKDYANYHDLRNS